MWKHLRTCVRQATPLHAVSRGHLAPLVGKRFVAGLLHVYFAWIHALFAFILLMHKFMILFCIGVGYLSHCADISFWFVIIKKNGKRRERWLNVVSCKQW